jgi:hypothetical protein
MASNSFAAKGWSIGLTTALIAYSLRGNNLRFAWVAVIPVALFWSLDAYYLALERGFRALFKVAVETTQKARADQSRYVARASASRTVDPTGNFRT